MMGIRTGNLLNQLPHIQGYSVQAFLETGMALV